MIEERTLTEADVEAIASALEAKLVKKFYLDLGKGVWDVAWKVIVGGLIALAAYGALGKYLKP